MRLSPLLLSLLVPSLLACSGTVSNGGSGGSGSTSSSSSTSGGGMGTGGGPPTTCPVEAPMIATPCELGAGQTCEYGDMCCPLVYACMNGSWIGYDINCAAPADCPAAPPADGSPCPGQCLQVSPCAYPCDQGNALTAECGSDNLWHTTASTCSNMVGCGDTTCAMGEICVESAGGAGFFYSCAPDPCGPSPLSCQCAAALCGSNPFECTSVSTGMVHCSCAMCP